MVKFSKSIGIVGGAGPQSKVRADIANCFSKLRKARAALFCIASHSFHGYLPALPTGFVNLITASLEEADRRNMTKALILASETTIRLQLYEQYGAVIACTELPLIPVEFPVGLSAVDTIQVLAKELVDRATLVDPKSR